VQNNHSHHDASFTLVLVTKGEGKAGEIRGHGNDLLTLKSKLHTMESMNGTNNLFMTLVSKWC
jgi:hypothetical protein